MGKRVFIAIKGFSTCTDNEIVGASSKSDLSKLTGISVSAMRGVSDEWIEVKGWNLIVVTVKQMKRRGKSI